MPSHWYHSRLLAIGLCAASVAAVPAGYAKSPVIAHKRASKSISVVKPKKIKAVRAVRVSRFGVPTFADSAKDDLATFDDPIVRQAAMEGLGRYNGSVVAVDPNTGRV